MSLLDIRPAHSSDTAAVMRVEREAFRQDEEADLVRLLLADPSAEPCVNLLAFQSGKPIGHVLFTRAELDGPGLSPRAALLAPLAVVPEAQGRGVGAALVHAGLERLRSDGVALVFVLGHADYYPRCGFEPAMPHGLAPPYALRDEHQDAWMVQALQPRVLGHVKGTLVPAECIRPRHYWGP